MNILPSYSWAYCHKLLAASLYNSHKHQGGGNGHIKKLFDDNLKLNWLLSERHSSLNI